MQQFMQLRTCNTALAPAANKGVTPKKQTAWIHADPVLVVVISQCPACQDVVAVVQTLNETLLELLPKH
jgi:hypothetical protein